MSRALPCPQPISVQRFEACRIRQRRIGTFSLPSFASVQGRFGLKLSIFQLVIIVYGVDLLSLIDHENHGQATTTRTTVQAKFPEITDTEKKNEFMTQRSSTAMEPPLPSPFRFRALPLREKRFALTSGLTLKAAGDSQDFRDPAMIMW